MKPDTSAHAATAPPTCAEARALTAGLGEAPTYLSCAFAQRGCVTARLSAIDATADADTPRPPAPLNDGAAAPLGHESGQKVASELACRSERAARSPTRSQGAQDMRARNSASSRHSGQRALRGV